MENKTKKLEGKTWDELSPREQRRIAHEEWVKQEWRVGAVLCGTTVAAYITGAVIGEVLYKTGVYNYIISKLFN